MVKPNQDQGNNLRDCQLPSQSGSELSALALATFSRSRLSFLFGEQSTDRRITEFSAQTFLSDLHKAQLIVDQLDYFPGFRRSVINPHQVMSEIVEILRKEIPLEENGRKTSLIDYLKEARKVLSSDQFKYLELMLRLANDHERLSSRSLPDQEREKLERNRFSSINRFNYYAGLVSRIFVSPDLPADQLRGQSDRGNGDSRRSLAS